MAKKTKSVEFKATEIDAKDSPVKDIQWEGEEIGVESDTKLEQDTGTGNELVIRFFDFAANKEVFKQHKPTAQELFNTHKTGMEAMLWTDGLVPYHAIEPRLMFAKDGEHYRFVLSCVPSLGNTFVDKAKTLTELLHKK